MMSRRGQWHISVSYLFFMAASRSNKARDKASMQKGLKESSSGNFCTIGNRTCVAEPSVHDDGGCCNC